MKRGKKVRVKRGKKVRQRIRIRAKAKSMFFKTINVSNEGKVQKKKSKNNQEKTH